MTYEQVQLCALLASLALLLVVVGGLALEWIEDREEWPDDTGLPRRRDR